MKVRVTPVLKELIDYKEPENWDRMKAHRVWIAESMGLRWIIVSERETTIDQLMKSMPDYIMSVYPVILEGEKVD